MVRFRFRACFAVFALSVALSRPAVAQGQDEAAPFFDDSVVHEVSLTINSRDWNALKENYLDNTYYPCNFKWGDQTVRNIGIRSRGTGSRSNIKPGLRVDFDRYTTSQKFLGLKSFVLRNNTQDPSNMHERISMLFFRRMGLPAPREAHTRLYINDVYSGMYTIVESVDRAFLKKTFNEDEGYLYKYDYPADAEPYYFEYRGSNPLNYVPLPFQPETHEDDARPEKIVELIRIIAEDGNHIFRDTIAPYLDLAKFIKHIAVEMFLGEDDGFNGKYGTNNFYLYRFQNTNKFNFIAWDKSETFTDGPTFPIFHHINDNLPNQRNQLTLRALYFLDLNNLYLDTLLECTRSLMALDETAPLDTRGWMEREIDKEYAQIKEGVYADTEKPYTNDEFEAAVESLRSFARGRAAFVTSEAAKARFP